MLTGRSVGPDRPAGLSHAVLPHARRRLRPRLPTGWLRAGSGDDRARTARTPGGGYAVAIRAAGRPGRCASGRVGSCFRRSQGRRVTQVSRSSESVADRTKSSETGPLSRPGQSESSALEVAGVVHLDGTVCRTASSRRSELRGASAGSAAIGSAAVDWMVSARFHPWPARAARTRPGFGSRSRILGWPIAVTCEFLARSERMCALNQGLELACAPGPCGW
jgi:hypothetical protein